MLGVYAGRRGRAGRWSWPRGLRGRAADPGREGPDRRELARAKAVLSASLWMADESPASRARAQRGPGPAVRRAGSVRRPLTARVEAVTADDMRRLGARLLSPAPKRHGRAGAEGRRRRRAGVFARRASRLTARGGGCLRPHGPSGLDRRNRSAPWCGARASSCGRRAPRTTPPGAALRGPVPRPSPAVGARLARGRPDPRRLSTPAVDL